MCKAGIVLIKTTKFMKKKRISEFLQRLSVGRKISLAMRLTVISTVLFSVNVFAGALSQTVNLKLENATLREAFKALKQQTGVYFVFNEEEVAREVKLNVNLRDASLHYAMEQILSGLPYSFECLGEMVVIKPAPVIPQRKEIKVLKGRVTDAHGEPLPGVTIMMEGATRGCATDMKGEYALVIENKKGIKIIYSFVGMASETRVWEGQEEIDVRMHEATMSMDEVLVTGYQTLSRREMASAVAQVKASDIMLDSKFSVDQMLAGQVAGLTVLQTSGEPGATPKIRIRGTSSIIGSKAPLWVLDGVILDDPVNVDYSQLNGDDAAYLIGNAIAGINPRDIETLTVLKDASATAIYGVQAANGVIVITTKKGKEGKTQISYNTSFSINQRPSYGDFHLMNARERMDLSRDIIESNITYGRVPLGLGYEGLYMDYMNKKLTYEEFQNETQKMADRNTDWYDLLFRNALSQNHTLSFSGGSNRTTYYASIGFDNNLGTANRSESKRYTAAMKINSWLNEKVYLGMQLNGSVNKSTGFHASVNPNKYAYETSRTIPGYDESGELFYYSTRQKSLDVAMGTLIEDLQYNILHEMSETGQEGRVAAITGKLDFQWNIWKGIRYEFMGSYSHQQSKTQSYATEASNYVSLKRGYNTGSVAPNSTEENKSMIPYGGILTKSEQEQISYTIRNTIAFNRDFAHDHVVSIMAASEIRSVDANGFNGTYYGWQPERGQTIAPVLTDGYTSILNSLRPVITDNISNYVSWIGSASYTWKDKVTLNGNIRADGSNKFGESPEYRFLPIWSVAAKYTLTQEEFLKSNPVLSYLSFRGSYGIQGNIDKASSPDLVIQVGAMSSLTHMNESYFKYLPNPELRWEKTKSYNFGIDFSLWDGRISGTFDFYKKKGEDMIMSKQVSQSIGMDYVKINGGELNNTGVEGNLRFFPLRKQDWEISVNLIYSYNKNELISANKEAGITVANQINGEALIEGEPLGTFYSYRFAGLDHDTGYPLFYNTKEEASYALYEDEVALVKSGVNMPPVSGGFDLNFRYKNLRVGLGFQYALGGHDRLPNIYRNDYYNVFDPLVNVSKDLTKRWRNPGDEEHTLFPVLWNRDFYNDLNNKSMLDGRGSVYEGTRLFDLCDARVAKTDNLRLRSLSVSYLIPDKIIRKLKIQSAMLTFQTQNLFLITAKAWNGRDPESGNSNTPLPKVYTLGLNVSF